MPLPPALPGYDLRRRIGGHVDVPQRRRHWRCDGKRRRLALHPTKQILQAEPLSLLHPTTRAAALFANVAKVLRTRGFSTSEEFLGAGCAVPVSACARDGNRSASRYSCAMPVAMRGSLGSLGLATVSREHFPE